MRYVFIASVLIWAVATNGAVAQTSAQTSEWAQVVTGADTLERSGNYQEAALGYEAALRLTAGFGPADRRTQVTLNKLAMAYDALGRYPDSIHLYERALVLAE